MSSFPLTLNLNGKTNMPHAIYAGDTYYHEFTFVNENGVAIDKSASTIVASIHPARDNSAIAASFDVAVGGPSNNIVSITMDSAVTETLRSGNYFWDLQETAGSNVRTLFHGYVRVVADVS